MDFTFDKTPASRHRANMSSHTSVDTPSNKINRGPRNGKRDNKNRQRFRTPTCFACGNPNHRIKDCPDKEKKDEWIAKRQENKNEKASPATCKHSASSSNKTEYASVARVVVSKATVHNLTEEGSQCLPDLISNFFQQERASSTPHPHEHYRIWR